MAADIPFYRDMTVTYGAVETLSPLVRRVVADNPGPFTFLGTNTYIVGHGEVAVIDPGPDLARHHQAVMAAIAGERMTHILLTHTHSDHAPGALPLRAATGAPVAAHPRVAPPPDQGGFAAAPHLDFTPDRALGDGETVSGPGWSLSVVHTPGHTSNHFCYALAEEETLFTGDHVMGWSTSVITPPDGNMADYMASLARCRARGDARYLCGHGPAITDPMPFVDAYVRHRRDREAEILACVGDGMGAIPAIVRRLYTHIPETMHAAAGRSVLAHLEHLVDQGAVRCDGRPRPDSVFRPA